LPPIYLGTDRERQVGKQKMVGMNAKLGKELRGSLYYLKPELLFSMIQGLIDNLKKQGFGKIYLIAGHGGSKQIEILEKLENKNRNVALLNPYNELSVDVHHADEYETALFWACYPAEEKNSRKITIGSHDDFFKYMGYDPRKKASLKLGKKMLNEIVMKLGKKLSKK